MKYDEGYLVLVHCLLVPLSILHEFTDLCQFLIPYIIQNIFSSPEPKAPGELIGWEASVIRPSSVVRPHFQTTSPLKPLGQM